MEIPPEDDWTARVPPGLRDTAERLMARWPGRIVLRTAAVVIRIELFDRSMSIAAQFFTSVFPILILLGTWFGGGSDTVADGLNIPEGTRSVLDDALTENSAATFGVLGALIVLISATSLSRALTRAFAAIWQLPRPKSRLNSAWRWLAAVLALALSLVALRGSARLAGRLPPQEFWQLVAVVLCYAAVGIFVPWLLLAGAVRWRSLAPGALLFAAAMMAIRPASSLWLPRALESSSDRYGTIGVAFTYLAWLYVVSFVFLAASALGQVIATDEGAVGRWIRGDRAARGRGGSGL